MKLMFVAVLTASALAAGPVADTAAAAPRSAPATAAVTAVHTAVAPGCFTDARQWNNPKNVDCDQMHLLWRGKQKRLPATGIDVAGIIVGFAQNYVIRQVLEQLLGSIIPYVGWIYSAVTGALFIADAIGAANGGTRGMMERYSGQCSDTWELYSKVRIRSSFASVSADFIWESTTRAETQWVRYLYRHYLDRAPDCNELRDGVRIQGKATNQPIGDNAWSIDGGEVLMHDIMCNRKRADGVPWSMVVAYSKGDAAKVLRIQDYCAKSQGTTSKAMDYAFWIADEAAETCSTADLAGRTLTRHRLMVADVPGELDDLKAAVGRPQDEADLTKYKLGRLVNEQTVLDVFNTYTKNLKDNLYDAAQVARLMSTRSVRDFVCTRVNNATGRKWIQEVEGGAWYALSESDKVFRDFFDYNSRVPIGTDLIGQATANLSTAVGAGTPPTINLFQAFVGVTEGRCHTHWINRNWYYPNSVETFENGTWCQAGEAGHEAIGALFAAAG